jgi:hypothetical protein
LPGYPAFTSKLRAFLGGSNVTLQDLANLGEVIGAIAVIASLIYLAFEIRQNTQAMRRAATQDIHRSLNEQARCLVESPDLAALFFRASQRPSELTGEERFRFQMLLTYALSNFEMALGYYREGLLGDEMIEGFVKGLRPLFENPLVVEWWEAEGHGTFSHELRDFLSKQPAA